MRNASIQTVRYSCPPVPPCRHPIKQKSNRNTKAENFCIIHLWNALDWNAISIISWPSLPQNAMAHNKHVNRNSWIITPSDTYKEMKEVLLEEPFSFETFENIIQIAKNYLFHQKLATDKHLRITLRIILLILGLPAQHHCRLLIMDHALSNIIL